MRNCFYYILNIEIRVENIKIDCVNCDILWCIFIGFFRGVRYGGFIGKFWR